MGATPVAAETGRLTVSTPFSVSLSQTGVANRLDVVGLLEYDNLSLILGISQNSDGRYGAIYPWGFLASNYYRLLDNGAWGTLGPVRFRAGRFGLTPEVDSRYALFRNPVAPAAPLIDVVFDFAPFTYRTEWVQLTYNSFFGYPDRGAAIKTYALDLGEIRFGLQDASIYEDSFFDFEFFASPMPGYVTQYVNVSGNLPTAQSGNDNSVMGGFLEWRPGPHYAYFQFLIDDINLNRFFFPDGQQLPDKLAFTAGGEMRERWGTVGLHLGMATKQTFQPIGDSNYETEYSYTFVPSATVGPDGRIIPLEDNYLGYLWGENALSTQVTYEGAIGPRTSWGFDLAADLEWVISGAKSPANPWHDVLDPPGVTEFLNDAVLNHRLVASAVLTKPIVDWLTIGVTARLGHIWNDFTVRTVDDSLTRTVDRARDGVVNNANYIAPALGANRWITEATVTIGASWSF